MTDWKELPLGGNTKPYTIPNADELLVVEHSLAKYTTEIHNILASPTLPDVLKSKLTPAYFSKKRNNFHLRMYHDPKVRHYSVNAAEMGEFLETPTGERISSLSTYNYATNGVEVINYFMGQQHTPLGEYIYDIVVEKELKLQSLGLATHKSLTETMDREEFNKLLVPYLARFSLSPEQVVGWAFSRDLFDQMCQFFTDYFKRVPDETIIQIQYQVFLICIEKHLAQPWISDMIVAMTEEEAEEYIRVRYFQ